MGRKKRRGGWKLTKEQEAKRIAALQARAAARRAAPQEYSGPWPGEAAVTQKMSKLQIARDLGYKDGYAYAENFWKAKYEAAEAKLASRAGAEANLKAARDFLSVAGQTIQAFAQVCLSQTDSQGKQA